MHNEADAAADCGNFILLILDALAQSLQYVITTQTQEKSLAETPVKNLKLCGYF